MKSQKIVYTGAHTGTSFVKPTTGTGELEKHYKEH
jgi:hypothetical protein